ncbi:MAG TPA: Clp protease N-terminal domain-containing protein, partial [Actinomycetota bacterium]|nr:Clp protease N-terminal domain-containing protein [Actinomycetota bacterium]
MFERFTRQARGVVTNAVDIAGRRKDGYVRPDHLLLAIASIPEESQAAAVLKRMGATRDALAVAIAPETKDAALLATLGIDLDEVRRRVEYS